MTDGLLTQATILRRRMTNGKDFRLSDLVFEFPEMSEGQINYAIQTARKDGVIEKTRIDIKHAGWKVTKKGKEEHERFEPTIRQSTENAAV